MKSKSGTGVVPRRLRRRLADVPSPMSVSELRCVAVSESDALAVLDVWKSRFGWCGAMLSSADIPAYVHRMDDQGQVSFEVSDVPVSQSEFEAVRHARRWLEVDVHMCELGRVLLPVVFRGVSGGGVDVEFPVYGSSPSPIQLGAESVYSGPAL